MALPDYENDPALQAGGGDWFKFQTIGDTLIGTVTNYRRGEERVNGAGKKTVNGVYEFTKDDGAIVNLEVGQSDLKGKFQDGQITLGDKVRIVFSSTIPSGKPSPIKIFTVDVQKAGTFTPAIVVNTVATNADEALATLNSKLGATPVQSDKPPF